MSTPSKKGNAWSEEEKRTLTLHIIAQLLDGGKVDCARIAMANRTPKAISHAWAGIKTEIKKLQEATGSEQDNAPVTAPVTTPVTTPVATPKAGAKKRKRSSTAMKQENTSEDNDADEEDAQAETFKAVDDSSPWY